MIHFARKHGFWTYLIQIAKGSFVGPMIAVPVIIMLDTRAFKAADTLFHFT